MMPISTIDIPIPQEFVQLGISLLLGLLVGLQREFASASVGVRSFPLITVLGTVMAMLAVSFGGWTVAAGLLGVIGILLLNKTRRHKSEEHQQGTTTDMAALVMYGVGAMLVMTPEPIPIAVPIAIGGGVAVLLQFKPELHALVRKLGNKDLVGIMQFVLITCIILPILPQEKYGPAGLEVFNPFETWLMVALIVGMNVGGYITYKLLGRDAGIMLGGVLGGAISSTATTVSYSRQAKTRQMGPTTAAIVILIASTVVFVRVLIEISVVHPSFLRHTAVPICIMMGLTAIPSLILWYHERHRPAQMPEQENPTQLKSALMFGAMYAIVLFALAIMQKYYGQGGLYLVAALSGATDMDAITLSTARLARSGDQLVLADGWRMILIAIMSNLVFKAGIVAVMAGRKLFLRIALLFLIPFLGGVAMLIFFG
jgi:uncharacterized membrane protein (DUF4010 family)